MTDSGSFHTYDTVVDGTHRYFATLIPHDSAFHSGLPAEAIMGEFVRGPGQLTPDAFQQNPLFIRFLAYVIGKHASDCPGLIAETQRQQDGLVCILDKRTPTPDGAVPPEDIIGAVEIVDGEMIRFHGSPNYRILTDHGVMQLDEWLRDRLIEELMVIANGNGDGQSE